MAQMNGQHRHMAGLEEESLEWREETGGVIPGLEDQPAFRLTAPHSSPLPVLIAVPHAGRAYPPDILADMRDAHFATLRLEDRMVDRVAEEVARLSGAALIVAHAPRAMLDLNRARDDVDWDMVSGQRPHPVRHSQANRRARSGLGLVPRRLPGFGEVWRGLLSRDELDRRIEGIHRPYHGAVSRELAQIRDQWGAALLLDLHSMPPLRCAPGQLEAPRFVLGDRFGTSCDPDLAVRAYRYLETKGKPVAHNRPYAGGFVLDAHSSPRRGLHALQLEVCRSTYLDARLAEPTGRTGVLAKLLAGLVRELGEAVADLVRRGQVPLAAE